MGNENDGHAADMLVLAPAADERLLGETWGPVLVELGNDLLPSSDEGWDCRLSGRWNSVKGIFLIITSHISSANKLYRGAKNFPAKQTASGQRAECGVQGKESFKKTRGKIRIYGWPRGHMREQESRLG